MMEIETLTVAKWLVFALALIGVFPLAVWLRRYPQKAPLLWFVMGLMPFLLTMRPGFDISLVTWAQGWNETLRPWPGYAKGIQVSAIDLLALAFYLSLPRSKKRIPFFWPMALYFLAVILSVLQAREPIAALFYAWQLLRMFFVYVVVVKLAEDNRFSYSLMKGIAVGICFEALVVLQQKFVLGVIQPSGTFNHPNLLGVALPFAIFPMFALLLVARSSLLSLFGPVAGVAIAALVASRATLGLTVLGLAITFMISAFRQWTPRKTAIAFIGAVALSGAIPIVLSSFQARFALTTNAADASNRERDAHEAAAAAILANNPMGVGANNYSFVATEEGYARLGRLGTDLMATGAAVHNIYWLTVAETGYLGLVALLILFARLAIVAFHCGWRNRTDRNGDLLLGLGTTLIVVYIHGLYEWGLAFYEIQYLFIFAAGLVAGIAQRLGYWRTRLRVLDITSRPMASSQIPNR